MKLKIRADNKDVLIFAIFCIVLFYVVAIGFINMSTFLSGDGLHGFNPIPAFTPEYFAPVLVFFTVFLIVIFSSVSSYFFKLEKGIGIKLGKKDEKGYSRWLTDKEMKEELKMVKPTAKISDFAGIPIINNGREMWVDDSEYHSLIIGSTGSGKTTMIVLPLLKTLAKKGESMIITDPKGEIYVKTSEMLRAKGYNIILLNFRSPQKGNSWNPMQLPYELYKNDNQDKSNELLDDLALNIIYDKDAKNDDPFWEQTSADYFAGLSLALFDDAKREQINLNSIGYMTTAGEEKALGTTYIKEYFSHKDPISPAYVNVSSTLSAPPDTKNSILSVFKQKIKIFTARENLSEMLAVSDFDMKDIGREKTAVFLIIHDEKKTYHSLLTIFIKQCYETLIDVAQESPNGKLKYRTNFILDEFANMPPLKDVTTMVTAARSRNMRFNFIIQNFAQLNQVYGKENADTIKGNCGNLIYLISSELNALEEISKMCGDEKSGEKDKTDSRPLVTVSDLQRMSKNEMIVLRTRKLPYKTKVIPDYEMDWGYESSDAEFLTRDKNEVEVFDLKKFVEEKRKNLFDEASKALGDDVKPEMFAKPAGPPSDAAPSKGIDLDALIQRMDQKIAELEKEEAEEAEKMKNKPTEKEESRPTTLPFETDFKPVTVKEPIKKEEVLKEKPVKKEEPVEEKKPIKKEEIKPRNEEKELEKNESNIKTEKKNFITDDQFFDDFFGDE